MTRGILTWKFLARFIKQFLNWLFKRLSEELFQKQDGGKVILSSHLPFFGKFLGDGVLLLWDVSEIGGESRLNIVKALILFVVTMKTNFSR